MPFRHTRTLPIAFLVPSTLVAVSTGVLGVLTYIHNRNTFNKGSLFALLIGEFISVVALPLLLVRGDFTFFSAIVATSISSLLTLGAGLHTLDVSVLIQQGHMSHPVLFKAFVSLFVASLFLAGISLGSLIDAYSHDDVFEDGDFEEVLEKVETTRYRSNSGALSMKEKMVSLKASAATLVETAGRHDDVLSISQTNRSNKSKGSTLGAFSYKRNNQTVQQTIPNYSIKKLSVINQSTSSMSVTDLATTVPHSHSGNTIKSSLFTPTLSRFKNSETPSKTIMLERDALKRIPSALLPPHLKPHTRSSLDQQRRGSEPIIISHSSNDISSHYFDDHIVQQIPRAATVNPIMPYFKDTKGLRTISLEDYEKNYDKIQQSHSMGYISAHTTPVMFTPPVEEHEDALVCDDGVESITETIPQRADDSTDEALRYIEDAQEASHDSEILKSAMDQTGSKLDLQALDMIDSASPSKTKSHSPHKSIFSHSRKGSQFSNRANVSSAPGSPVRTRSRRHSPRKLGIKNLSLSSIVYKDDKDDIPNFSYVHELQSSPTKKKQPVPETPLKKSKTMDVLQDKTNTTPDSSWSDHSHRSVFPSEVIGEYDKEKWKTMVRLQMVGGENTSEVSD